MGISAGAGPDRTRSSTAELRDEQRTMLLTLAMHALDAESRRPILDDRFAGEVLDRVSNPPSRLMVAGDAPVVCARARTIDDLARQFLSDHDDAVVLHLGCGLDSRVRRLTPGAGVDWFDVDQEPVMALRDRLVPLEPGATRIATTVTDASWWADVPTDRPRLVVAEGLLMYLTPDGVRDVVSRSLAATAPACLLADTVAPWTKALSNSLLGARRLGIRFRSTSRDLDAALATCPDLRPDPVRSLPVAAAELTHGPLRPALQLFALAGPGRDAMVLHRVVRT